MADHTERDRGVPRGDHAPEGAREQMQGAGTEEERGEQQRRGGEPGSPNETTPVMPSLDELGGNRGNEHGGRG